MDNDPVSNLLKIQEQRLRQNRPDMSEDEIKQNLQRIEKFLKTEEPGLEQPALDPIDLVSPGMGGFKAPFQGIKQALSKVSEIGARAMEKEGAEKLMQKTAEIAKPGSWIEAIQQASKKSAVKVADEVPAKDFGKIVLKEGAEINPSPMGYGQFDPRVLYQKQILEQLRQKKE